MRYSEIIGSGCYGIGLSPEEYQMTDFFYSGAAHHYYRWRECGDQLPKEAEFHLTLHRAHLRHLMSLVYERGNFDRAFDPTLCDMDEPDQWNPEIHCIPDMEMFDDMSADPRVPVGKHHPNDKHLTDLRSPTAAAERRDDSFRLRIIANA